jgi:hypothetical protein
MLDAALVYAKYISGLKRCGSRLHVEKQIDLFLYDERAFGTADAVIINYDELHVIDFKYGAGYAVEIKCNPQLRFYALGSLLMLSDDVQERIKTVSIGVVQPRAIHPDGIIRTEVISAQELLKWGDEVLKPAMEATKPANAPLVTGSWCRWCPALSSCPEQGKIVVAGAVLDFCDTPALPEPKVLTPEQISLVLANEERVNAWFAAVRARCYEAIESGGEVPGWRFANGRKSKVWVNEADAMKALVKEFGDAAYTKKLISPAQAVKMGLRDTSIIAEIVGSPALVAESDRRKQYVKPSPVDDFKEDF